MKARGEFSTVPLLFLVTSDLDPQYQKRTIDNVRSAPQEIR